MTGKRLSSEFESVAETLVKVRQRTRTVVLPMASRIQLLGPPLCSRLATLTIRQRIVTSKTSVTGASDAISRTTPNTMRRRDT